MQIYLKHSAPEMVGLSVIMAFYDFIYTCNLFRVIICIDLLLQPTHRFVIGRLRLELFHEDAPLFVLAPLVLKPNSDDPRAKARHLHQLLLHECIGPGVGVVAGP